MNRLAQAEKPTGSPHWIVYDGHGGVFRARRDTSSGLWTALRKAPIPGAVNAYTGRTLRQVRERIAAAR